MDNYSLAQYFDHTLLKSTANKNQITTLCDEAKENNFFSVCINPYWVSFCNDQLKESTVKVCTVVGFPLGANSTKTKLYETKSVIDHGADEIDFVINVGALKSGEHRLVKEEVEQLISSSKKHTLTKIIIESGALNEDELNAAITIVKDSGADFIKTSTGFTSIGATHEAIKKMKLYGGDSFKIKASGGIRNLKQAIEFIDLGAHRIGASQSVQILTDNKGVL